MVIRSFEVLAAYILQVTGYITLSKVMVIRSFEVLAAYILLVTDYITPFLGLELTESPGSNRLRKLLNCGTRTMQVIIKL